MAQNSLHTFPHRRGRCQLVVNLLATWPTSPQQVVVMEFGKRHDTTGTMDFCPHQLVTDLSFMLRTCYREVANLLQTCYGESDVMDFCLNLGLSGKWFLKTACCVIWCVQITVGFSEELCLPEQRPEDVDMQILRNVRRTSARSCALMGELKSLKSKVYGLENDLRHL